MFARFVHSQAFGSALLLAATVAALLLANSRWSDIYFGYLHTKVGFAWGSATFALSVQHWINDLLMVVFFFVVGLEIKRELVAGQLSTVKKAVVPVAAALGGMIVPALLYAWFNPAGDAAAGWGIPMATDIAFALGVLALFGARVPVGLKVFLTALAIADDLGAVLVIAIFYTDQISWPGLAVAAAFLARDRAREPLARRPPGRLRGARARRLGGRAGVRRPRDHRRRARRAGGAGQVQAQPARVPRPDRRPPVATAVRAADAETACSRTAGSSTRSRTSGAWPRTCVRPGSRSRRRSTRSWRSSSCRCSRSSTRAWPSAGTSWTPCVTPSGSASCSASSLGKQVGVTVFTWLAVTLARAERPEGVSWSQIYGGACLAGIGFTMSMFVDQLAFSDPENVDRAKIGILMASVVAAAWGAVVLAARLPRQKVQPTVTVPPKS